MVSLTSSATSDNSNWKAKCIIYKCDVTGLYYTLANVWSLWGMLFKKAVSNFCPCGVSRVDVSLYLFMSVACFMREK